MPGKKGISSKHTKRIHKERAEKYIDDLIVEAREVGRSYRNTGQAEVVLGEQLAKIVQEWRDEWLAVRNPWTEYSGNPSKNGAKVMGPLDWLKEKTGLNIRRINGIVAGEFRTVSLSQADAILTAIERISALTDGTLHIIPNPNWSLEKWTEYMRERGCI